MNHLGGLRRTDIRPTGEYRGRKMPLWILSLYLSIVFSFPNRISVLYILILSYPSKWKYCCYACVPLKANITRLSPLQMIWNGVTLTDLGQGQCAEGRIGDMCSAGRIWSVLLHVICCCSSPHLFCCPSPIKCEYGLIAAGVWVSYIAGCTCPDCQHIVLPQVAMATPEMEILRWLVWPVRAESPRAGLEWAG